MVGGRITALELAERCGLAECARTICYAAAATGPIRNVSLGGVRSHAEPADRCSACHAPAESGLTMESLCLGCHTDVRSEIDRRLPLHGRLTDAESCRKCHTEHRGPQAVLTDFAHFDHGVTATWQGATLTAEFHKFPIFHGGGKNRGECAACHTMPNDYRTYTCYGCHRGTVDVTRQPTPTALQLARLLKLVARAGCPIGMCRNHRCAIAEHRA